MVYHEGFLPSTSSFDNIAFSSKLPDGYAHEVAPASELPAMPVAMPLGLSQPQSYQLCLWLCLWGSHSLRVTGYAYGYAHGVAPVSELPAMPMAMPMG